MGDVTVAKEAGDIAGVTFVGLDFIAGLTLGFGGGHEDTIDVIFDQISGDHKAGGACFVANFEVTKFDFELFGKFLKGFGYGNDASRTLAVVGGFLATSAEGVGDGIVSL